MRRLSEWALYALASRRSTLRLLNAFYRRLGPRGRAFIQTRFAGLYRTGRRTLAEGQWSVEFAGRTIALPMHAQSAWLNWDAAVSILGVEQTLKEMYREILSSTAPPDLFIDVGANYGTHSLLFLSAGVETISFEPNAACHPYFREVAALNHLRERIEPVALGAEPGRLELYFPEHEEWLGSLDTSVAADLRQRGEVRVEVVEVRTLDEYEALIRGRRALVKIDAEGFEHRVLSGAAAILTAHRPVVLFESNRAAERAKLLELFTGQDYRIADVPDAFGRPITIIGSDEFLVSRSTNFLALPSARVRNGTVDLARLFGPQGLATATANSTA